MDEDHGKKGPDFPCAGYPTHGDQKAYSSLAPSHPQPFQPSHLVYSPFVLKKDVFAPWGMTILTSRDELLIECGGRQRRLTGGGLLAGQLKPSSAFQTHVRQNAILSLLCDTHLCDLVRSTCQRMERGLDHRTLSGRRQIFTRWKFDATPLVAVCWMLLSAMARWKCLK